MNKFKYDEAKNKLVLDIPCPKRSDFGVDIDSKRISTIYSIAMVDYDNRLSYDLSPELKAMLTDGQVYELGKDFTTLEINSHALKFEPFDKPELIAIPLPEAAKEQIREARAFKRYNVSDNNFPEDGELVNFDDKNNITHLGRYCKKDQWGRENMFVSTQGAFFSTDMLDAWMPFPQNVAPLGYPIFTEQTNKPQEEGIYKKALEEIIHTTASKSYTPFQKVDRCFGVAAAALGKPQEDKPERLFTLEQALQIWDAAHLRGFQFEQYSGKAEAERPTAFNKEDYFSKAFGINIKTNE